MRLYLALAVLMLAFVAYTEAQDESIEDKLNRYGEKMSEVGRDIAERTRASFDQIHNSEFAVRARGWFAEKFDVVKANVQDIFHRQAD